MGHNVILAVDDKADNLFVIQEIIEEYLKECIIFTARSAEQGLDIIRKKSIDIAMIDVQMPGMDGIEMCRQLKDENNTIPVILLTAHSASTNVKIKGFEAGADEFITKPIDSIELVARIKVILRIKASEDALRAEKGLLEKKVQDRTIKLIKSNEQLNKKIIEHQHTLKKLKQSEAKWLSLLNNIPFFILESDLQGKIISSNQFKTECETKNYTGNSVFEIAPSKNSDQLQKAFNKVKQQQENIIFEIPEYNSNNEISAWYFYHLAPIKDHKELKSIIITIQDITCLKKTQEALKESQEEFKQAFENANDGIFLNAADGIITKVNKKMCNILGYDKDEFIGMNINNIFHFDDMDFYSQIIDQYINCEIENIEFQKRYTHKQGDIVWGQISNSVVRDADHNPLYFISHFRDITQQKQIEEEKNKLEKQLRQTQKMEAIGTLAGGIAHDFNNILCPIIGYSQIMLEGVSESNPFKDYLNQILLAAKRARDLVYQILTFSRQMEKELQPLKIQFILKEILKLSRATLPSTIDIDQDIDKNCGPVMADTTHIHQIIMNLITNAFHAMESKGGILKIRLKNVDIKNKKAYAFDLSPGHYVCLSVSDTGNGIEKSIVERIFDPYFTTKDKGKGTGLGLSVVHGIVKNYKGDIKVYSEVGKGTVFHVYLPRLINIAKHIKNESMKEMPKGNEHILLVDDEINTIKIEKTILETLGYEVTAKTNSIEAMEEFKLNPYKYHIVITDMTMPNMTGAELAKELLKIRNNIPIIICTGFSHLIDQNKAKEIGIKAYIMKPIIKSEMANTIREILDNQTNT